MNENKIIDGFRLAAEIRGKLKEKINCEKQSPVLAVILAGDAEASCIYVRNKEKAAAEAGIKTRIIRFAETVSEKELLAVIEDLNSDNGVDGILVQQPLPKQIDPTRLVTAISPEKDVDGFSPYNLGLLQINSPEAVVAATPKGVLYLLKSVISDLTGKSVVIIGRSNIVGKPLSSLLLNQNCTVTVVHSKTVHLAEITKQADIIVAACGCPRMVKKDWIKDGAVVVDVGINRVDGKLCGDVDFDDVIEKAAFVSPVPKGVGPMTIAMLLENTYEAFCRRKKQS